MGRNEILLEFWESEEVNNAFTKMHPIELQKDLKSEVFLILAEIQEEKLQYLYEKNLLRFYIVRVMLNLVQNVNNKFYKNYRNFVEYKITETTETEDIDLTTQIQSSVENLHWYKRELLKLYTEKFNCNATALSKYTKIPYMSIIRTLNQTKSELKSKIRNHD
jgi:hypothetical protein